MGFTVQSLNPFPPREIPKHGEPPRQIDWSLASGGARREEEIEGDLRGWSVGGGERRPRVVAAHGTVDGGEVAGDEP